MATHRHSLPQLGEDVLLADGGIETTLVFHDGLDLPYFAAFHLLSRPEGTEALTRYFRTYAAIGRAVGMGVVLETPTWRASADWAAGSATTAGSWRLRTGAPWSSSPASGTRPRRCRSS